MSAIKPLFRLTVYKPAIEDPTETTVLTPIGGAAHADPFVVTTMQGVGGAKPYLAIGLGRQGQLDYVSKKTTTGNLKLSVFDPRVTAGGANAVRWSTAFLGDALGRTRLKGCKFLLERSLDGTVGSLVPFTAGRIRNASVSKAQWLDLDVKDFADDLNRPLFTGQPHASVTYASLGPLLPNGLVKPFGNATLTPPLAATIGAAFATAPNTVVVNVTSPSDPAAMITQAVLDSNGSDDLRLVELTVVSTGVKHYYQWPRGDAALASTNIGGGPTPHFGLTAFPIAVLPSTDARTEALPAVGTAVTVSIYVDAPPTEATPLLVNDVHPVQYLADLIDGKFSVKPGTTTLHPLGTRNSGAGGSWATLVADASFGTMRDLVTQLEPKANEYLEKTLLQRFNLALVRDGSGNLDVVDLRRTASLAGVATLTDADLVTADDASWDDSRDGAITAVAIDYWLDHYAPVTDLVASGDTFPTLSPSLIKAVKSTVLIPNDLSTLKDVGEKVVKIESKADRISTGDWNFAHFGRQRIDRVKAVLAQAAIDFLRPIGTGTITARATYRLASATAQQIAVGKYFIVQHTKLPNPAANQRGGSRLMLCLSADERDGKKLVQWLDAGTGAVATTPSITSVTSANAYSVDVTLAANAAGDPILVHVAVTPTSTGTHPAESAAEWIYAAQTAAGTIHIANLPQGKRVWVRAQSYGNAPNTKLPSAWVYAAYLDLAAGSDVDLSPPEPTWTPIGGGEIYNQCLATITDSDDSTVTVTVTGTAPIGTPTVQLVAVTAPAALVSGAAIGSPVASGSTWVFSKGAALAGDGGAQFRAVLAGNVSDDDFVTIPEKAPDVVVGQQILSNPAFAKGLTGYSVYDNFASGHVHHTLGTDSTTPNATGKYLQINVDASTTPGVTVDPGFGGFSVGIGPDSGSFQKDTYHRGAMIEWRVRAFVPVGYTINWAANAFGTGAVVTPLTPMAGTGAYFDYRWLVQVGTSGTFSTIGYFYLTGSGTGPIGWQVAQVTANDRHQTPTFGPSLDVTPTPGSPNYSIAYTASGGTVELSINGGAYSTAPASPISVARPGAGATPTSYAFRLIADGQTITDEVTVPSIDADTNTVTPDLTVTPSAPTDTQQQFTATASNPAGGAAPALYVTCRGTTGSDPSYGVLPDGVEVNIVNGNTVTVNRPAFGTTAQASVTFRASLAGGGSERIQRTILNQVKTSFGPSLTVTPTVSPTAVSIVYTYTGTIQLKIDSGSYGAPAASPISVTRDGSDHTYTFKATLDGQEVSVPVDIPALTGTTSAPSITGVLATKLSSGSFSVSWGAANIPSGATYDIHWRLTAGDGGGATSGDSNGNSSSPVTITVALGTSPSANVSVTAKLDGVVLASGGTSGPMAT